MSLKDKITAAANIIGRPFTKADRLGDGHLVARFRRLPRGGEENERTSCTSIQSKFKVLIDLATIYPEHHVPVRDHNETRWQVCFVKCFCDWMVLVDPNQEHSYFHILSD